MNSKLIGSITLTLVVVATGIGVGVYYGSKNNSDDFRIIAPPTDDLSIGICQELQTSEDPEISNFRLSGNIVPSEYNLILYPNMDFIDSDFFAGYVEITSKVHTKTNQIVLHSSEQKIRNIEIVVNSDIIKYSDCVTFLPNEFLIIRGVDLYENDEIVIKIEYEGPLLGRGVGFFKTSYKSEKEGIATQQQLIGSKHEPTYRKKCKQVEKKK